MAAKSTDKRLSRYVQGGTTDIFEKRLGWWDRSIQPFNDDDDILTITAKYDQRPHLVAYDWYGERDLMWLVLEYNTILDVTVEFVVGTEIRLPKKARVFREMLNKQVSNK